MASDACAKYRPRGLEEHDGGKMQQGITNIVREYISMLILLQKANFNMQGSGLATVL
jgi:hypothetical protein